MERRLEVRVMDVFGNAVRGFIKHSGVNSKVLELQVKNEIKAIKHGDIKSITQIYNKNGKNTLI